MFDRTSYHSETKVCPVTKETIVHNTITPDRVTDMYDKVEDEVKLNIIKKHLVKSDYVTGFIAEIKLQAQTFNREIIGGFKINEKPYTFRVILDDYSVDLTLREADFIKMFHEEYIKTLSGLLVMDSIKIIGAQNIRKRR